MDFEIDLLSEKDNENYNNFLLKNDGGLLYYSTNYKKLLEKYIGLDSYYFLAKNKVGEIVAVFPIMIFENLKYGKVANSLPYYGSNGSIIVDESLSKESVKKLYEVLTNVVLRKIKEENCVASTFITNPLIPGVSNWFKENLEYDFTDYRIGQITSLPKVSEELDQVLMKCFSKPRPRNIKKAIKSGVTIRFSNEKVDMDFLFEIHKENIEAKGGIAKERSFFNDVMEVFGEDGYKIVIGECEGKKIAALLIFYFNKTVEYFTPATLGEYRSIQPSSLLIFEGMKDAIQKGYSYWNWGGTWQSQKGVYDFKKKWGAEDYNYEYYTMLYDKSLLNLSANELTQQFNHTFVVPFNQLINYEKR